MVLDFLKGGFVEEDGGFIFIDLLTRTFAIYIKDVHNLLTFLDCALQNNRLLSAKMRWVSLG